jgi:hypothetical protein
MKAALLDIYTAMIYSSLNKEIRARPGRSAGGLSEIVNVLLSTRTPPQRERERERDIPLLRLIGAERKLRDI